jgi:hypothetical protein
MQHQLTGGNRRTTRLGHQPDGFGAGGESAIPGLAISMGAGGARREILEQT